MPTQCLRNRSKRVQKQTIQKVRTPVKRTKHRPSLLKLPNETISRILSFVQDQESIQSCRVVNRQLNDISSYVHREQEIDACRKVGQGVYWLEHSTRFREVLCELDKATRQINFGIEQWQDKRDKLMFRRLGIVRSHSEQWNISPYLVSNWHIALLNERDDRNQKYGRVEDDWFSRIREARILAQQWQYTAAPVRYRHPRKGNKPCIKPKEEIDAWKNYQDRLYKYYKEHPGETLERKLACLKRKYEQEGFPKRKYKFQVVRSK